MKLSAKKSSAITIAVVLVVLALLGLATIALFSSHTPPGGFTTYTSFSNTSNFTTPAYLNTRTSLGGGTVNALAQVSGTLSASGGNFIVATFRCNADVLNIQDNANSPWQKNYDKLANGWYHIIWSALLTQPNPVWFITFSATTQNCSYDYQIFSTGVTTLSSVAVTDGVLTCTSTSCTPYPLNVFQNINSTGTSLDVTSYFGDPIMGYCGGYTPSPYCGVAFTGIPSSTITWWDGCGWIDGHCNAHGIAGFTYSALGFTKQSIGATMSISTNPCTSSSGCYNITPNQYVYALISVVYV